MTARKALIALVALGVVVLSGCSGEVRIENPNFQSSPGAATVEPQLNPVEDEIEIPSSLQSGRIGEKVTGEGFELTLNTAKYQKGGEYFEPENDFYLVLNFTVENTSEDPLSLSSWGNFELQGSDLYIYSLALGAETKGTLDSDIAPGGSLRGEIAFDVPSLDSYEVRFKPEMFSDFKVVFAIDSTAIQKS
jgi:hypothetical protein